MFYTVKINDGVVVSFEATEAHQSPADVLRSAAAKLSKPTSKHALRSGRAHSRDDTLLSVLRSARLCTEDGTQEISDFSNLGLDRLDFTSVSRSTLRSMLEQAYEAGYRAACGVTR